jgi:hypothetical protein
MANLQDMADPTDDRAATRRESFHFDSTAVFTA